jgi:hypothetical protein
MSATERPKRRTMRGTVGSTGKDVQWLSRTKSYDALKKIFTHRRVIVATQLVSFAVQLLTMASILVIILTFGRDLHTAYDKHVTLASLSKDIKVRGQNLDLAFGLRGAWG